MAYAELEKAKLNQKEKLAFNLLIDESINETGGEFGYSDQCLYKGHFTPKQWAGYCAQLVKKDLIMVCDESKQFSCDFNWCFTKEMKFEI